MKKAIFLVFLLTVSIKPVIAQERFSISGTVTDEKGQSIPGATVFLTNTKNVTVTDASGKFILNDLVSGPYEMAVKMLGFTPDERLVKIENKPVVINVTLKEAIINLNTVDIKGKPDPNREKYIQWFTENFIGKSTNASQCKILNPDALSFYYNKKSDILNAYADDFLVIENSGLGYRLKYLLKQFRFYRNVGLSYYEGDPYFEDIKGSAEENQQWAINRRMAYLGSNRHFFRAVMNNTAAAEGFAMYQFKDDKLINKDLNSVFQDINNNKTMLSQVPPAYRNKVRAEFYIVYKRAKESGLFRLTGGPVKLNIDSSRFFQFSRIVMHSDTVKIDKELLLNPPVHFGFYGYWAWERISEYLPLDYFVDPLEAEKRQ